MDQQPTRHDMVRLGEWKAISVFRRCLSSIVSPFFLVAVVMVLWRSSVQLEAVMGVTADQ